MGRRPLPESMKATKGQPAKRLARIKADAKPVVTAAPAEAKPAPKTRISRAQREDAERQAAAAELAAMPVGTKVEPPARLRGEHYAGALAVWRELGPELERTNRLQPIHRQAFAMFCIYIAEWWAACDDLAAGGRSQHVPTVSGGSMERDRPAVRWRAEAFAAAQDAAKHFGLTPREEYALFKDQSTVARENPGLFGHTPNAPANDEKPTSIGAMSRFKSAGPPGGPRSAH